MIEAANGPEDSEKADLVRRLARYRRRVEAEGRVRSVKLIDHAIRDSSKNLEDT
jgi:hypothetical protein